MRPSSSQYSRKSLPVTSARLPTEAKEETPSRRSSANSARASPRAPLWLTKPTLPAGGGCGMKVASRRDSGAVSRTPRQLGPTSRIPFSRQIGEQLALARGPLLPGLREAGGEDDQRPRPLRRRFAGDRGDGRRRDRDHRHLDLARHRLQAGVGGEAAQRSPPPG